MSSSLSSSLSSSSAASRSPSANPDRSAQRRKHKATNNDGVADADDSQSEALLSSTSKRRKTQSRPRDASDRSKPGYVGLLLADYSIVL
jgi:hypothetical protein